MSKRTIHVVDGEASESDRENEIGRTTDIDLPSTSKKFAIASKAPESVYELRQSPPPLIAIRKPKQYVFLAPPGPKPTAVHNSLLHQKIYGEASKSDTEIKIVRAPDINSPSTSKTFIIVDEAPKSHDESRQSPPPLISIVKPKQLVYLPRPGPKSATMHNSMLYQKFYGESSKYNTEIKIGRSPDYDSPSTSKEFVMTSVTPESDDDGEASESDTEIEIGRPPDIDSPSTSKKFVTTSVTPESDDDGEASESDTEIEIDRSLDIINSPSTSKKFIIVDEAPKSHDESGWSLPPLVSISKPKKFAVPASPAPRSATIHNSLHHQKLYGEASESDTEIEIGRSPDIDSPSTSKTFVIAGEAPESDDESRQSPPPLISISKPKQFAVPASPAPRSATIHNSLLHQKLWEANVSCRANVEGLVKHTTDISLEKLKSSDRTLLNVQESIRATTANLTLAQARLKQLRDQLLKANCPTALPTLTPKPR